MGMRSDDDIDRQNRFDRCITFILKWLSIAIFIAIVSFVIVQHYLTVR